MFGIGGFELFIIVVFIFVIFGPSKLPEIIQITGMGIKKFRKAKAEMDKVLQEEIVDPVMKVANEPDPPKKENKLEETKDEKPEYEKPKVKKVKPEVSKSKVTSKTNESKSKSDGKPKNKVKVNNSVKKEEKKTEENKTSKKKIENSSKKGGK